jgi:hypothetical protein
MDRIYDMICICNWEMILLNKTTICMPTWLTAVRQRNMYLQRVEHLMVRPSGRPSQFAQGYTGVEQIVSGPSWGRPAAIYVNIRDFRARPEEGIRRGAESLGAMRGQDLRPQAARPP